jgi:cyclopropane fatty-acyl-phospholipid synthase-like methyltransferase
MSSPETGGGAARDHVTRVADYYDANTRRFMRSGEGSRGGAIHRCVWTPDATTTAEAADTVNRLLIERLRERLPAGHVDVLDLGCGVGATMVRLAQELTDASVTGVTISPVQAEIGARRFAAAGLARRCRITVADFAELPAEPRYHAIVAIESVVHSPSLASLIPRLAERLRPGGRLILCDDWVTEKDRDAPERARCLAQFRAGWRIGSLHTVDEAQAMAEPAGLTLVENLDLTPYLRLGRPRDRVIEVLVKATRALPWIGTRLVERPLWANMIGGSALQTGLARRWIEYRVLVFDRT